jgi:hypothetical protein
MNATKNVMHFRIYLDKRLPQPTILEEDYPETFNCKTTVYKALLHNDMGMSRDRRLEPSLMTVMKPISLSNSYGEQTSIDLALRWKISNDLQYIQFYWGIKRVKRILGFDNGKVPVKGNFVIVRTAFRWVFFFYTRLIIRLRRIRRRQKKFLFICAITSHLFKKNNTITKIAGIGPAVKNIYEYL